MVNALIKIDENTNRVLNVVKAKFGLKDKGEAINLVVKKFIDFEDEPDLRPEFVKKITPFMEAQLAGAASPTDLVLGPAKARAAADIVAAEGDVVRQSVKTELTGESRLQAAQADLKIATFDRAREAFAALSPELQQSVDLRETFGVLERDESFRREAELALLLQRMKFAASIELQSSRTTDKLGELFEELHLRSAKKLLDDTRVGTLAQWSAYLENPALGETEPFEHLREAIGDIEEKDFIVERARISGRVTALVEKIQEGMNPLNRALRPDDAAISFLVMQGNRALAEVAAKGGPNLRMRINKTRIDELEFIQESTGEVLAPEEIENLETIITSPRNRFQPPAEGTRVRIDIQGSPFIIDPTELSAAAQEALRLLSSKEVTFEEIMANPNRRVAVVEVLRAQVRR